MRTIDMTPFYRTSVGFDRLFDEFFNAPNKAEPSYPPYNIERVSETNYRITLAVAGFSENDLDIEVTEQQLRVLGTTEKTETPREYLHQGIAGRNFERRFQLAENVRVTGADLANGLLHVDLEIEIPEAMKPRKIAIGSSANAESSAKVIDGPGISTKSSVA